MALQSFSSYLFYIVFPYKNIFFISIHFYAKFHFISILLTAKVYVFYIIYTFIFNFLLLNSFSTVSGLQLIEIHNTLVVVDVAFWLCSLFPLFHAIFGFFIAVLLFFFCQLILSD